MEVLESNGRNFRNFEERTRNRSAGTAHAQEEILILKVGKILQQSTNQTRLLAFPTKVVL